MSTPNHFISNPATDFGTLPYHDAMEIQRTLVQAVRDQVFENFLMILEHPPVYTAGRKTTEANLNGVKAVRIDRGGDVTYHGPGQLVFYPIFRVGTEKIDVRSFVKKVENTVIESLSDLGFIPFVGEEPGIWIEGPDRRKVCSIGMAIDHGISYHGIAINYSSEVLDGFMRIRPCDMDPSVMGSLNVKRSLLKDSMLRSFRNNFANFMEIGRRHLEEILGAKMEA